MHRVMGATPGAAGWYEDPTDAARRRYWDGAHWAALTQPPCITPRPTHHDGPPPVGTPENPIGAGSVALAAAFASLTAAALDGGLPPAMPSADQRRRRRWGRTADA
ncbi:MAG TPA: DUF2510 domain-containing protein [Acidimicrobiales bacterium]|nr:DUF2510 domain-containing protein [Acidimicrobiales bacterium]